MATSKPKQKVIRQFAWFYGIITCANVLIIGMFFLVSTPAPVLAVYHPPVHHLKPKVIIQGIPIRVVVPSVGIDLPIQIGIYNPIDSSWTLGTDSAFYANASVPANNNNGTTLIYAHAQTGLFGELTAIQPGATAQVYTNSGAVFSYTYQSLQEVDPSDTSIFSVNTLPTLTLQTCTGDWSQYRALYSFTLTEVSKP
jgi:LPXTG-site transpeptidase (sortase) family protein